MIDIPGDLVWDLPYMQQASYLEGGPLMWMLHLYLHQKFDDDDDEFRTVALKHMVKLETRTVFSEENVCPRTSLNRYIVKIDCIYNKLKVTM